MMLISRPGKTDGYVLLDAILAILVATLFSLVLIQGLRVSAHSADQRLKKAEELNQQRNTQVEMLIHEIDQ